MNFESTDRPPDADPDDDVEVSSDLVCEVCGTGLFYSGRGRKPKRCEEHKVQRASAATPGRRAGADVEAALAVLDGMYQGVTMALFMVSSAAASTWSSNAEMLQAQNRLILTADRELTKKVNKAGAAGGQTAFILAHVVALVPVGMVIRKEIAERPPKTPKNRNVRTTTPTPYAPPTGPSTIPDPVTRPAADPLDFKGPPPGFFG